MNIAAIIAEYDPFHTGHAYHLQKTREISGADAVICIMSGSFVQRGRPACIDKFTRTRLALEGGADMVLELPSVYSLQSAEFFARGAVRLLEASNMVDHLSFGVEQEIVSAGNPDAEALRASLDAGEPYSRALGSELAPNSLLGAEYLRAIEELGSNIKCIQVRRNGAGHDSMEMSHNLSASRLRAMMAENKDVSPYTKVNAARYLDGEKMFVPLLCALRSMQPEQIEGISQVSEGLQYLIKEGARSAKSLDGLIMACKSKRYTYSRLSRIMCCAFLGITSQMTDSANKSFPYIRVLGVKKNRTDLLGVLNSKADLPVCVNSADFLKNADEECAAAFLHECKVTDLRAALNGEEAGADFTSGLILV